MKTEEVTAELLEWLKGAAEKSAEFVEREAPLLAQEVVAWTFWSNAVACTVMTAGLIASAVIFFRSFVSGEKKEAEHKDPSWEIPACIFSAVAFMICLIAAPITGGQALKAKVAPRLVIIESLKGITK